MFTLITGGTGSGKSEFAEAEAEGLCGQPKKPLLYIATLEDKSAESAARIEKHRKQRAHIRHRTAECFDAESLRVCIESAENNSVILFDSLDGFLACNACNTYNTGIQDLSGEIIEILRYAADCSHISDIIVVSDMVFSDGTVYDKFTADFIDVLGRILKSLAQLADNVVEVVCGIAVPVPLTRESY